MEAVKITSNVAELVLKGSLNRAEAHLRYLEEDIVRINGELQKCMYDKVLATTNIDGLKAALDKCQKQ